VRTLQGNGIYLSPEGEKYIGSWSGGKKEGAFTTAIDSCWVASFPCAQLYLMLTSPLLSMYRSGKGRYMFKNGDFYDGEFHKDKAHGVGVYYHSNGNIFTGQWVSGGWWAAVVQ
jgi:hypothetical protein